jgi:hypothetical protein
VKIQVFPAVKSTPCSPLYVWRLFDGSTCLEFGMAASEAEALRRADQARREQGSSLAVLTHADTRRKNAHGVG